ncbi:hypothetical protein M0Q50_03495 [bacterium]|jgi:hypothetical protein|nr:hypothetical protein [bacterium]
MKVNIIYRLIRCIKSRKNSRFDHLVENYDIEEIINIIINFSNMEKKDLINLNNDELEKIWNDSKIDDKLDSITK